MYKVVHSCMNSLDGCGLEFCDVILFKRDKDLVTELELVTLHTFDRQRVDTENKIGNCKTGIKIVFSKWIIHPKQS